MPKNLNGFNLPEGWSEQDKITLNELLELGILTPFDENKFTTEGDMAANFCFDNKYRRLRDSFSHLEGSVSHCVKHVHPLTAVGGFLEIIPDMLYSDEERHAHIKGLLLGQRLRGGNIFSIVGHYPCGAAALCGLSLKDYLRKEWVAAEIIKQSDKFVEFPNVPRKPETMIEHVSTLIQLDLGTNSADTQVMKTYYADVKVATRSSYTF